MADQLQLRGGTTNEHSTFTGALREVTVDTDKDTLIVHDAATAGGHPLAKEDLSNVPTGTITSTMIADGTIVNADINASAEIAVSKLADGAARQLLQTDAAGTGVEWTNNVDVPGTLDVTSVATFDNIASHSLGAAATPSITFTGDTNTGLYSPGADQVAISTGGTARLYINSSGQVGVGTTSPSSKLHIYEASASPARIYLENTEGRYEIKADANLALHYSNQHIFNNAAGTAEYARIDSSGRVGVGTSSPGSYNASADDLVIDNGTNDVGITLDSTTQGTIAFTDAADTSWEGWVKYVHSDDHLEFGAGSARRMTISSAGNVGVGTTSPGHKLVVSQNNSGGIAAIHLPEDESTILGSNANTNIRMGGNMTVSAGGVLGFNTDGSERLRIDSSGRVGIGTSSPNAPLTISGPNDSVLVTLYGATGSDNRGLAISTFTNNTVVNAGVDIDAIQTGNGALRFSTQGTPRMFIDEAGRTGIGTTSPDTPFQVYGASGNLLKFQSSTTMGTAGQNMGISFVQSGNVEVSSIKSLVESGGKIGLTFSTYNSGLSESARIDSSGRLLVGTSSASISDKFIVYGNVNNNDEAFATLSRGTAPADGQNLGVLAFSQNVDRLGARILAQRDGGTWTGGSSYPTRLVFSTTADGASSPTERVRIQQDGSFVQHGNVFYVTSPNTSATFPVFAVYTGGSSITSFGTVKCRIHGDGDVENVNNRYTGISDIKLKENITDAGSQWSDIKSLQVRNFNFKAETTYSTHTQIGLIAQEVESISPGLVSDIPDRDQDGNDLGTVTKSVSYSVLYMKAVKALQEAMERIETLEAKVAALEAN